MTHCEAAAIAARWHSMQARRRAMTLDTPTELDMSPRASLEYAIAGRVLLRDT